MIGHHKRPYNREVRKATWFNADTIPSGLGDPESDIPGLLFRLLEGGREVANHKIYGTVREAEEAFLTAWQQAGQRLAADPEGLLADFVDAQGDPKTLASLRG